MSVLLSLGEVVVSLVCGRQWWCSSARISALTKFTVLVASSLVVENPAVITTSRLPARLGLVADAVY